ncbi:hypothetical protein HanRHA438_Chr17g0822681 [Helianthus annuus]|nr:hypothetical protein HanIR_Chr17g0882291 [Helianthus annuus]KAJ0827176.1 hypothetical protein HanRHA438_Chr17g0822681 [Helianthus annuus]
MIRKKSVVVDRRCLGRVSRRDLWVLLQMDTWTGMMMRMKSVSLDWIDRLEGREIWGFVWSLLLRFEMCLLQVFL